MNVNLMKHFDDEDIWQESFWVYRETLVKCLTLNSLIPMLKKPDDVYVSQSPFIYTNSINMKTNTNLYTLR